MQIFAEVELDQEVGCTELTAYKLSNFSIVWSSIAAEPETPTLATTMSSLSPTIAFTASESLAGPSGEARSVPTPSAVPPAARISAMSEAASSAPLP